jgi:CheY-like chemotaxis protein
MFTSSQLRNEMYLNLKKAREQADDANAAKGTFLARMSHELRTPLSAVLGISEIELRNFDMPPRTEAAFAKIYNSAKTLLHIVNDILDLSKIESGKMSLLVKEYETEALISDVAQLHLIYTEQKNIGFKLHVDAAIPLKMKGDALRIKQIITNLLTNAFKYSDEGTVSMSLSCEEKSGDCAVLIVCIEDTGIGMTAEQISALKSDYVRLHENEKPFVGGTGLGIPIVYSLAHIMNAKFDITSETGKGTTVTVRIPQEKSGKAVLGQALANSLQNLESNALSLSKDLAFKPEQMPHGKVLVVDDVDTNLYVAQAMLESFGLTVELVESGYAAIDKITAGNTYDVIFLDHMMPGMNGVETTKILRGMGYNHPIVMLTADAIKGQAEVFMENGFSGFMTKPIDIKILNSYLVRFVKK